MVFGEADQGGGKEPARRCLWPLSCFASPSKKPARCPARAQGEQVDPEHVHRQDWTSGFTACDKELGEEPGGILRSVPKSRPQTGSHERNPQKRKLLEEPFTEKQRWKRGRPEARARLHKEGSGGRARPGPARNSFPSRVGGGFPSGEGSDFHTSSDVRAAQRPAGPTRRAELRHKPGSRGPCGAGWRRGRPGRERTMLPPGLGAASGQPGTAHQPDRTGPDRT